MHNGMQGKVFIIYIVAWAISGLVFYVLIKKTDNIKKKKKLEMIAGIFISLLLIGFALIMGLPFETIPLLVISCGLILFLNYKYTFYCPSCRHRHQQPFVKIEFCPKCGAKIE